MRYLKAFSVEIEQGSLAIKLIFDDGWESDAYLEIGSDVNRVFDSLYVLANWARTGDIDAAKQRDANCIDGTELKSFNFKLR